ncbi:MAG: LPXTG cell wall anchor domain-containing protein [Oscillospiraceae bacterium]|jgi:LPXTG-motif cell wall-anchored protein|nr:LPXTG cell wall anchor domain-containing protein [Oscillospiraceae bacterium]
MHRIKQRIILVLCLLAVISGTAARTAAVGLPAGFLIGDSDGIRVSSDGEYIINAVGLMPGNVLQKTITIRNLSEGEPYTLTLIAEPLASTGPIDLLNAIELRLTFNGGVIYEGRVRGDEGVNMIENALQLGEYATGAESTLNIWLKLDETVVPSEEISVAEVKWIFNAVRKTTPMALSVKTGELADYAPYIGGIACMLLISLALVLRRRKKEQTRSAAWEQPIIWTQKGVPYH